jgi:hypothetical protein
MVHALFRTAPPTLVVTGVVEALALEGRAGKGTEGGGIATAVGRALVSEGRYGDLGGV